MSPKGSGRDSTPRGLIGLLLRPFRGYGPLIFALGVVVAVVGFGTVWVWEAISPRVIDAPAYRLDPQQIVLIPSPEWITADDLKQDVIRDASLDGPLSIMDDKLTERIALAFAAHPWVACVDRVEKFHPARVVVTLNYRKPVAVVAIGGELCPIDRGGVVLPREHFSSAQLARLPRISGISTRPAARAGNVWQDARVQGAALIAEAIGEAWQELDLAEILPSPRPVHDEPGAYTFELVTHGGKHVAWGRQPLTDDPSEPSPSEKLRRLKSYVEQHGKLDGVTLDDAGDEEIPRTARNKPTDESPR